MNYGRTFIFSAVDCGQIPAPGIVTEPSDATGVNVKAAILIEISARDPANDPDNGKIMTHDQYPFRIEMPLDDLIEPVPCALGDIGQSFAARDTDLGGFTAPPQ